MASFSKFEYRADVDGLRAIAVCAVLLFHAFPSRFPGLFIGVDIFFVISGYLITGILLKEISQASFTFYDFYGRRIKRIFPALIVMLVMTILMGMFFLDIQSLANLGFNVAAGTLFSSNIAALGASGYFDIGSELNPVLNLWSLGIEEQFYILFPFILLLSRSWDISHRIKLLFAIFLMSFICSLYFSYHYPSIAYYLPFTRAWELIAGALVASLNYCNRSTFVKDTLLEHTYKLGFFLGIVFILLGAVFTTKSSIFPGWIALLPVFGTVLILYTGQHVRSYLGRILENRLLVYIGLISYPLYLFHWPLLVFVRHASFGSFGILEKFLAILGTFICAILCFEFIEKPVRNWKMKFVMTSLLSIMALICFASILMWKFPANFAIKHETELAGKLRALAAKGKIDEQWNSGTCFQVESSFLNVYSFPDSCLSLGTKNKKRIALIGDSHAAALLPGILAQFGADFQIAQLTASACIPLIVKFDPLDNRVATKRCELINIEVQRELQLYKPDIVIIGTYFYAYSEQKGWLYPYFVSQYKDALLKLQRTTGSNIILIGQVPVWEPSLPITALKTSENGKIQKYTKFGLNQFVFDVDKLMNFNLASKKIRYVSLIDKLCKSEGCLVSVDGSNQATSLFSYDYGHLSPIASNWVASNILSYELRNIK